MKIAIMQPYLFPYIGYFQLINAVDKFVVFDDVNYITKGWINRNRILLNNAEYMFTVPLEKASQNKLINEISLSQDTKWKNKFIKTIEMAYKRANQFDVVFPIIKNIIDNEEINLSRYILYSLNRICSYLGIKTKIIETSKIYRTENLKGQDKIIEICLKENASEYVNPIGGTAIYEQKKFNEKQMSLKFLKSEEIVYEQFNNTFIPCLSFIDVMMFNEKNVITDFLNKYTLEKYE